MPADATALSPAEPFVLPDAEALKPLVGKGGRWRAWLAALVSFSLFAGVLWQLRSTGLGQVEAMLDRSAGFWVAFVLLYITQPVAEVVIFKRLWGLPISAFGVLLRKFVSNEIVFGYSGEVYFYLWARDRVGLANAPFAAIKDVSITSALIGNGVTLVMLALAVPALRSGGLGAYSMPTLWSGLAIVGISLAILLLGRKIFSLKLVDLTFISGIHLVRMLVATGLTGLVWHFALPGVGLGLWVILAALRLLVSRLPFVTNKDLVFANLAIFLVGRQTEVGGLLAALAVLTLAAHLAVIAVLGAGDLIRAARKA